MFAQSLIDIIFIATTLIVSISLHEYAHAWTSVQLGDPTPKLQGRLTPNPLKHIDPIGFVLVFLIGFGRGKAVQVNPRYYKHPLRDELLVALAGPAVNLLLALAGLTILLAYGRLFTLFGAAELISIASAGSDIIITFRFIFAFINVALAVFNMLPLPPLDGFRIVKFIFPQFASSFQRIDPFVLLIILFLILQTGILQRIIVGVSTPILNGFFVILSHFIYL